jgi:hypothetical protein
MEMGGQARVEEMLRACTTAPTEAAGIIGDNEDLNIHGDLSKEGERRLTGPLQLWAISLWFRILDEVSCENQTVDAVKCICDLHVT